ncbi:MAG: hypothetical protein IJZ87_06205 [Bacteroidales bacterium]|nr:hypothetical protein [Bacteroidales bacterium]
MKRSFSKILVVALAAGLLTTSCVEKSKKYQQLLAEKEAAVVENQNIEREYNNALGVIADVENNLQALREAEGLLLMNNENVAQREQLNSQLIQIKEAMAQNNAKLDSLNKVLQNSNRSNKELRATIKKLQNQIEEKTKVIDSLQVQLNERDTQIVGLNTRVENLNSDLAKVNADNDAKNQIISEQVAEMNTVYYIAANKKSLKENGILTSKYILRENVPTEMFTKSDKRDLNEITIEAKKVVVLSSHPMSSYTINKTETTNVLQITNPEQFWSVTKYLVISTK